MRKVDVLSFWTAKGVTMQYIRNKVEEEMRTQGIQFGEDVVDFMHTHDVWRRTLAG